jgi:serine protease Do
MDRTGLLPRFRTLTLGLPVLTVLAVGAAGCSQRAEAAPPAAQAPAAGQPAPFANPPTLPGTLDTATLAAKVKPAVEKRAQQEQDPFEYFFRGPRGKGGGGQDDGAGEFRQRSLGTGILVDDKGHVVTNAHVVEDADQVKVRLADEREIEAIVRGRDARLDIAVLELKGAKDLPPPAALGDSESLRVGEYVVAIGNPFGLGHTVTMGIVSAKGRAIGAGPYDDFIQTDASINPGNSGGPLFDTRGRVIGINTAINPAGRGIGFAIPINDVKAVLPDLLSKGTVSRGRLGLAFKPLDGAKAKELGFAIPKGAIVGDVEPRGPADRAGLRSGDVILAVGPLEVVHATDLPRFVARNAPGTKVDLTVLRDRKEQHVGVVLDEIKEPATRPGR